MVLEARRHEKLRVLVSIGVVMDSPDVEDHRRSAGNFHLVDIVFYRIWLEKINIAKGKNRNQKIKEVAMLTVA